MTMPMPSDPAAVPALLAADLTKVYAGGIRALDGLRLTIPPGSFFGLLGPNGAGKTTLIGGAAGLVRVPAGHLFVFGHDAVAEAGVVRQLVGLAPQEVHLDRFLTTREGLVYHGRYFGMTKRGAESRADELLAAFDLTDKADVRPNRLSGGMRRRLLIARALMHRPPLVVLDEPTAGVDLELRHELWRYLRRLHAEEEATILLTTHYIEEAEELCERIAFIRAGQVVAEGTPAALRQRFNGETLEDVYYTLMGPGGEAAPDLHPGGEVLPGETVTPLVMPGGECVPEASSASASRSDGGSVRDEPVPLDRSAAAGKPAGRLPGGVILPDLGLVQRRGSTALAGREVRRVLSLWSQTIIPPVLTALLYLLVFGGALGARLRQIEGVPYLTFILPGLLVMTVAGQAFANNATTLFQAKYEGHIEDVLSSPIGPWRMAAAYMVGGLVRSAIAGAVIVVAAAPFTERIHSPLLALVGLGLTSVVFAGLGVVTGIWAETFDQFSLVANLIIAPLTLVAGVFYSVRQLKGAWSVLTRFDPIYYLVAASRSGFLGLTEAPLLLSLTVAAGVGLGLFGLAVWMLARGWRLKP